ncbi:hypothetical protein [Paraburkholderia sp. SIMBA_054]|uniref:hypothetical protein n=1 Tax=Paraburkholderia sp. SIMBA_054 TaxID=3085795 RepID=UPI003978D5FB
MNFPRGYISSFSAPAAADELTANSMEWLSAMLRPIEHPATAAAADRAWRILTVEISLPGKLLEFLRSVDDALAQAASEPDIVEKHSQRIATVRQRLDYTIPALVRRIN